jgi:hypothetical protein
MAIVIAILLALILVALVSSNKSSANAVLKVLRISLVSTLVGLIWMVWVGYLVWYFLNSEEQNWYELISIVIGILLPPVILWIDRDSVKKFFKSSNLRIFTTLPLILFGVILFEIFGVVVQDFKKDNPNVLLYANIAGVLATGFYLNTLTSTKGLSFKQAFGFPKEPYEIAEIEFDDWYDKHIKERDLLLQSEEYRRLSDEEKDEIFDKFEKEYDAAIQKKFVRAEEIKKNPKRNEYVAMTFWFLVVFLSFQLIGFSYDFAQEYIMTLDFIKNRSWLASIVVIGTPILLIGLIIGVRDDVKELKERKR